MNADVIRLHRRGHHVPRKRHEVSEGKIHRELAERIAADMTVRYFQGRITLAAWVTTFVVGITVGATLAAPLWPLALQALRP